MSAVRTSPPEMISIREFARRDGCDEKLVRNAIKDGDLKRSPGGKLAASLVGSGWRLTNRRVADTPATPASRRATSCATPQQLRTDLSAAAAHLASKQATPPLAESEARKEHFLALLRQLEYEEKVGLLIPEAQIETVVGAVMDALRAGFLRLPTQAAALLVGKDQAQITAILAELVRQILSELSEIKFDAEDGRLVTRRQASNGTAGHG